MVAAIPDRWLQYKACGKIIDGTRIICFKVPLERVVQIKHPEVDELWDIEALLKKIPKLGAVVDLTNTARYYDPKKFEAAGISHKKIFIPGRIIPPEQHVTQFMNAVDEFLEKNDDDLVGVHCTHGLNRTGYMVCRYMRDRLGVPAADAIRRFELARGYQIERENFIADLLGKTPPPPDDGPNTEIKPINNSIKHKKTFHTDYEEDEKETTHTNKRRLENKQFEGENQKVKKKKNNNRSSSERSDRSYDFKYDY